MQLKDVFVIPYGSTRWAWRFEKGVTQKLCKDKFEAIEYAKAAARQYDSDVYVQQKDGTFKKLAKK